MMQLNLQLFASGSGGGKGSGRLRSTNASRRFGGGTRVSNNRSSRRVLSAIRSINRYGGYISTYRGNRKGGIQYRVENDLPF